MLKAISWIVCLSCCWLPSRAQLIELKGVVTYSTSYCGGAAPSQEIINETHVKRPFAYAMLYIRRGEQNNVKAKIIAKVKTDSAGKFVVKLKPGTYSIVDSRKKSTKYIYSVLKKCEQPGSPYKLADKKCLTNWLKTPDALIHLNPDTNSCTIHYVEQCKWNKYPCIHYSGPMPP